MFIHPLDGDARNEVFTTSQLAKHRHDPNLYRVNAYTGLNYDPMSKLFSWKLTTSEERDIITTSYLNYCYSILGPVPTSVDLKSKLEQEKRWERQRQTRQRRLSEPAVSLSKLVHILPIVLIHD